MFCAMAPTAASAAQKLKAAGREAAPEPPMAPSVYAFEKIYAQGLQFTTDTRRMLAAVTIEGSQFAVQERDPSTGQLLRTLFSGEVDGGHDHVAISANGRILAIAMVGKDDHYGQERTIGIFNLMNGRPLANLTGHEKPVHSLSLSDDGRILASGSGDYRMVDGKSISTGQIRVWNLASRKLLYEQPDAGDFRAAYDSVAVSRDGTTAAWLAPKGVHVINVADAKESAVIRPRGDAWGICLSPDGKTLGILGHTYVGLFDIESKKARCEFIIKPQGRALGAFSADGRTFVYSAHFVMVFVDANSGKALGYACIENKNNYLQRFALSPDGKRLAGKYTFQGPGLLRGFDATSLQTEELDHIAVVAPAEMPGSPEDVLEGHSGTATIVARNRILKPKTHAHDAEGESPPLPQSRPEGSDDVASATPEQPAAPTSRALPEQSQSDVPSAGNKPSRGKRAGTGSARGRARQAHDSSTQKDEAALYVGTWRESDSKHLVETWTIARDSDGWKITGSFEKAGKLIGSCHGESIRFDGTELSFTRVLDKKPTADAIASVHCKLHNTNGRMKISFSGGGKNWSQLLAPAGE
jgi:WD40 repeat protein